MTASSSSVRKTVSVRCPGQSGERIRVLLPAQLPDLNGDAAKTLLQILRDGLREENAERKRACKRSRSTVE